SIALDDALASLVRRHAHCVSAALDAHDFAPVLAYDDRGQPDGSAWAVGFLRAVEMAPGSWDAMLEEKEFGDALEAIETLAATLDDGAGARALSRRDREVLIERLIADVADIHEFFRPYRQAGTTPQAMRVETVRREQPKLGRNEPCPCGSGRKYKACCGAA
ncbi:MAG: YecA family protein, partial [Burkholderiales bacterium]